jgi:hypothetical protein
VFTVRASPGGPTAAPDAPPASDSAPATPNTVTAFVRPFRFEFRLPCDMVEDLPFTPALPAIIQQRRQGSIIPSPGPVRSRNDMERLELKSRVSMGRVLKSKSPDS